MYYNKDRGAVCKSIRGFWPSTGIGPQKKDTPPKILSACGTLGSGCCGESPVTVICNRMECYQSFSAGRLS